MVFPHIVEYNIIRLICTHSSITRNILLVCWRWFDYISKVHCTTLHIPWKRSVTNRFCTYYLNYHNGKRYVKLVKDSGGLDPIEMFNTFLLRYNHNGGTTRVCSENTIRDPNQHEITIDNILSNIKEVRIKAYIEDDGWLRIISRHAGDSIQIFHLHTIDCFLTQGMERNLEELGHPTTIKLNTHYSIYLEPFIKHHFNQVENLKLTITIESSPNIDNLMNCLFHKLYQHKTILKLSIILINKGRDIGVSTNTTKYHHQFNRIPGIKSISLVIA